MHRLLLFLVLLLAGCFSGWGADAEGLVIVRARWGLINRDVDVTEKLRQRIHNDTLELNVGFDALGDPAPGHRKMLRVTYRYHGVEQTVEIEGKHTLKLPVQNADSPEPTTVPTGAVYHDLQNQQVARITSLTKNVEIPQKGVEIVQAVFGINGMWRDVTPLVQQAMVNDVWRAELHYPFSELGGDPVIGKPKHLVVGYRVDGTPKVIIFDEMAGKVIHVSLP